MYTQETKQCGVTLERWHRQWKKVKWNGSEPMTTAVIEWFGKKNLKETKGKNGRLKPTWDSRRCRQFELDEVTVVKTRPQRWIFTCWNPVQKFFLHNHTYTFTKETAVLVNTRSLANEGIDWKKMLTTFDTRTTHTRRIYTQSDRSSRAACIPRKDGVKCLTALAQASRSPLCVNAIKEENVLRS